MSTGPAPPATVFVDADNTLWDTDAVFAEAQLALLEDVEARTGATAPGDRLSFIRALDQRLAERHHSGLRYPPKLLIHAAALALAGNPADQAVKAVWPGSARPLPEGDIAAIEKEFFSRIAGLPELRPGVEAGLDALGAAGCLILILTEGALDRIRRTADALGLGGRFDRIIEAPKQPRLFARVQRLTGAPDRAFMIGDQLDRDIAPAKAAGLETIYFPGGFAPRWAPPVDAVRPDHRIENFAQVGAIVLGVPQRLVTA